MAVHQKYVIRNSDRRAFKSCRRSWSWSSPLRRSLRPVVTPKPLEFGIAWHEAMAIYYDPDTWDLLKNTSTADVVRNLTLQTFNKTVREQMSQYEEMRGELFVELEEELAERLALGHSMLEAYMDYAPTVDFFTPVRVEVGFEVPIPDPREEIYHYDNTHQLYLPAPRGAEFDANAPAMWPVVYQGRIDALVQDRQGWYWNLEHKTTSQFNDMRHLDLDEQITSYGWAMRELGINLSGCIYSEALKDTFKGVDVLMNQRKGRWLSVNKQRRCSYEQYMAAIKKQGEDPELYAEHLAYLKSLGNPFFRRYQQHRTKPEYDEIGERIGWEAIEMINPDTPIYANPGRFNCSFCSFREPCLAVNQQTDHEFLLRELFKEGDRRIIEVSTEDKDSND